MMMFFPVGHMAADRADPARPLRVGEAVTRFTPHLRSLLRAHLGEVIMPLAMSACDPARPHASTKDVDRFGRSLSICTRLQLELDALGDFLPALRLPRRLLFTI